MPRVAFVRSASLSIKAVIVIFGSLIDVPDARAAEAMSNVKADEQVIIFSTLAHWDHGDGVWVATIHGWIFERERNDLARQAAIKTITNMVAAASDDTDERSLARLRKRLRWFLVDNERAKSITVRITGQEFTLGESTEDGHFSGIVRISGGKDEDGSRRVTLPIEVVLPHGDSRQFVGTLYCVPERGVSVISDIDDTIKVSEVTDLQALLTNTFLREFQAVDGMQPIYAEWAAGDRQFHYVSASPWQLYDPLVTFLDKAGFPAGSMHLRPFRLKDPTKLHLVDDPIAYKRAHIEPLLKEFPQRKFLLVGDSGEKDPEIYGHIARQFPDQVELIVIRNVTGESADSKRYQEALAEIPESKWQIFSNPQEIRAVDTK